MLQSASRTAVATGTRQCHDATAHCLGLRSTARRHNFMLGTKEPWSPCPSRTPVMVWAQATSSSSQQVMNYQMSQEEDESYPECAPSFVQVDNQTHDRYTILTIDGADYPGLLRTVAWVLNGMGMRVQHATLSSKDGWAKDVLWLTTWAGNKLTDKQAALTGERVQDFVVFCEPKNAPQTHVLRKGKDGRNTVQHKRGFLLELASVLAGTGTSVVEGFIQSEPVTDTAANSSGQHSADGRPQPQALAPPDYDFSKGRYFRFHLCDSQGQKLGAGHVGAILFAFDVFMDNKHMPLVAPNMDAYLKQMEQGLDCK